MKKRTILRKKRDVFLNLNKAVKRKIVTGTYIMGTLLFLSLGLIFIKKYSINSDLLYSQDYIVGAENIKGNVDTEYFFSLSEDFSIGANREGYAVFKNPAAALNELKDNYAQGIELIQEEFDLLPLFQGNYKTYGTYGWQVTTGTEEARNQAAFVSEFMDIYENSFLSN